MSKSANIFRLKNTKKHVKSHQYPMGFELKFPTLGFFKVNSPWGMGVEAPWGLGMGEKPYSRISDCAVNYLGKEL